MSVYVDDAKHRLGRMLMCHMLADTEEELHRMADAIGVAREHYQGDHYDVCKQARTHAIRLGALEVTPREMVRIRKRLRMEALSKKQKVSRHNQRKYEGHVPVSSKLLGKSDGWELYERSHNGQWCNIKLISSKPIQAKANYHLAHDGKRFSKSRDARMLLEHRPALHAWVHALMSPTRART